MPSSLEADEANGYFLLHDGSYGCSYLIVWLVRVNSTISCSRRIDTYIFRKFILVPLEQRATERTSSTMHRDLLDIQLLQTL